MPWGATTAVTAARAIYAWVRVFVGLEKIDISGVERD
jgi:hypothetical protein